MQIKKVFAGGEHRETQPYKLVGSGSKPESQISEENGQLPLLALERCLAKQEIWSSFLSCSLFVELLEILGVEPRSGFQLSWMISE